MVVFVGLQCGPAREQVHPAETGDRNSGGQEHGFPGSAATSSDADDGRVRELRDPEGTRSGVLIADGSGVGFRKVAGGRLVRGCG